MATALLETQMQPPTIPPALESDSEHVTLSLETAQALGENGDLREALRWLRRAADAAEQAGDDMRALTLARAAADLTTKIGTVSVPPPLPQTSGQPSLPTPPKPPTPPSARGSGTMPKVDPNSAATAELDDAFPPKPPAPSLRPPPPSSRAPVPAQHSPSPPKASLKPAPKAASQTPPPPSAKVGAETPMPASVRALAETPPPPSVRPIAPKPAELEKPAARSVAFDDLASSTEIERLVAQGRAVRVSVKRSTRDKGLYVVRRLERGKPSFGSREALIVLVDPDPNLFSDDD